MGICGAAAARAGLLVRNVRKGAKAAGGTDALHACRQPRASTKSATPVRMRAECAMGHELGWSPGKVTTRRGARAGRSRARCSALATMSTTLVEASEARKARLLALRKRKAGADGDDDAYVSPRACSRAPDAVRYRPPVKYRNYDPETRQLRRHTEGDVTDTVEQVVDGLAEKIIAEDAERRNQELVRSRCPCTRVMCSLPAKDVFSIAPKRPNWDLKREMERKLAKLERKTQEAILLLTRERHASVHRCLRGVLTM